MFIDPVFFSNGNAVFHLVWTYAIKEVGGHKKAQCTCDRSTCSGQVWVLDYSYANSTNHTCSHLFYAIAAAEKSILFGEDVSNAFAEAPPPKQGFFIHPDIPLKTWWIIHNNASQSYQTISSPSSWPCKDTLKHKDSRKNMLTVSFTQSDSALQHMNQAFIPELLMTNVFTYLDK